MKYVLVTAGNTSEPIDSVRKITNTASGKLGSLIADGFTSAGAKVVYICSSESIKPELPVEKIVNIQSVLDLDDATKQLSKEYKFDCIIHSMAVSDYIVKGITTYDPSTNRLSSDTATADFKNTKFSSDTEYPAVLLEKAPKVIEKLKGLFPTALLVGFKLLVNVKQEELYEVAMKMMKKNSCDFVIANDSNNITSTNHKALIIDQGGIYTQANTKQEIAHEIVGKIMINWGGTK